MASDWYPYASQNPLVPGTETISFWFMVFQMFLLQNIQNEELQQLTISIKLESK